MSLPPPRLRCRFAYCPLLPLKKCYTYHYDPAPRIECPHGHRPISGADLMTANDLQAVANEVIRLAQQQGYVVQRDVRDELRRAGLSEKLWKDVLALGRASLSYRKG